MQREQVAGVRGRERTQHEPFGLQEGFHGAIVTAGYPGPPPHFAATVRPARARYEKSAPPS
ncbi:hypothetical protein GCM10012287_03210 [Streptomyces daqingensis]|uniref:Uncharacterized protein n=1 Tax=Streptomyces daqingensis TaxID=1472640 RepID=A0ABQ2LRR4_9ACTN|nr:hypothetical protein GCM10012287_03210 [Streptomyces daqingensis]